MSLSVPEPIPSTKGSLVSYASPVWALEPRRCVLLGWLPGKREKADINPTNLSLAGSYVARLHQHSEQYGIREGLVFPHVWDWDWIFGEAAPLWKKGQSVYSRGDLDVFCATAERVWQDLQELGKGNNVFGIIHRDLHLNNFVFHDGKAYAIDFEVCGWGYYLFDLAVTLSSLEGQGRYRAPMQTAFIEGYQRERPLPEGEWRYLDTFIAMRIVQRVNIILHWEAPTWRRWGPNFLMRSVKGLKEYVSNKERAGQIDFGSPWWHKPFQK